MVSYDLMESLGEIEKAVDALVHALPVTEVHLFGSRVESAHSPSDDCDLLVVLRDGSNLNVVRGKALEAISNVKLSLDLYFALQSDLLDPENLQIHAILGEALQIWPRGLSGSVDK